MNNKDKEILHIALPAIVTNITVPLLGLIDVAITGHLGQTAYIGAIAVGSMLFNVVYWLFGFLRMGSSGMTAQAYGRADADEAARLRQSYDPYLLYTRDPVLHRVLDQLKTGFRDGVSYEDLYQRLLYGVDCPADQYLLLADFASYCAASHRVVDTYADREKWNRMSLHNIARSGIFSADRSIADYADTIWHVPYKK